ncbi:hypothetical protein QUF61_14970 [Candidatus Venteria ishoeyi]|uniref:hypothetical protein n=1 Tax=Candidatus Venteria ishoeyi TaxID=1899563 RepID=UPI0025A5706B|nr:hypothetical protein [Candidatus Venteria ishoeyi]MDM8547791.1 hypothetical protein [Candidatus Venteria ishoeyi]
MRLPCSDLARRIDVNRHTLRRWRSGEIARPDCRKILACLPHLALNKQQRQIFLRAAGCGSNESLGGKPAEIDPSRLSPFVAGQPIIHPQQFCGRKEIIGQIIQLWRNLPLQNVAVTGIRRSGKSSLLHYLKHMLPQQLSADYQVILVDFKEARMRQQSSLLQYLLQGLELPTLTNCSLVNFEEILSFNTIKHPTLVLMDDIEYGLAAENLSQEFWWGLRSIQHNYCYGHLGFLLSSRTAPAELAQQEGKSSPFFNVFSYQVNLPPFTQAEAEHVIARSSITFQEEDCERIITQAQGAPEVLQELCIQHLQQLEKQ